MTDRPIQFSPPMVRALLEGRKLQTRRVIADGHSGEPPARSPKIAVGDHLWVKERIEQWRTGDLTYVRYHSDQKPVFHPWPPHWKRDWAPPMFMPRELSRLTMMVTDVRVERVQEISEADAIAEGVEHAPPGRPAFVQFFGLWDSINAKRGYGWETNPWVVAVSFQVIKQNIDAMERAS